MTHNFLRVAICSVFVLASVWAHAQASFDLTDTYMQEVRTFTNTLGTAEWVSGMIVFEGELTATQYAVPKATNPTTGFDVASVMLLAQVKLFDELPPTNDLANVQGAVAAVRDAPASATGKYFVWGSTNSAPVAWVPLMSTNGTQFAVNHDATNKITFVFHYPPALPPTNVTYQVFIGEPTDSELEPSEKVTSFTTETSGINSVSLLGAGALQEVSSASGVTGPLSSSIGFSVYVTSKGILFILDTQDEQGPGSFTVKAWINGAWVVVGTVQANGLGHYEFYADAGAPLVVGDSYKFMVVDEIGNPHVLPNAVAVKAITMKSVVMEPLVMLVQFNTEPGRMYQVWVAESPSSTNWTPAVVYYPTAGVDGYDSNPFTVVDSTTTIKIPRNEGSPAKAFFKIIKTN